VTNKAEFDDPDTPEGSTSTLPVGEFSTRPSQAGVYKGNNVRQMSACMAWLGSKDA
jgi:hypothetical protein